MNSIERLFPWLVVGLGALYLLAAIMPPNEPTSQMQLQEFGKIPVVANGRVKPMDTFARTTLMVVSSGQQTFKDDAGNEQPAIKWLLDAMTSGLGSEHRAWKYKVFRIEDLQVLNLLGLEHRPMFWRYAIDEFANKIELIAQEATRASKLDRKQRDLFDVKLLEFAEHLQLFMDLAEFKTPLAIPPQAENQDWKPLVQAFTEARNGGQDNTAVHSFAAILSAYAKGDAETFNREVSAYRLRLAEQMPEEAGTTQLEVFFNHFDPFRQCYRLYFVVFLLACASWLGWFKPLNRAAIWLAVFTLLVHTWGLGTRMYIQGRPPVTNLYSAAVFIGWGALTVALIVEMIYHNGIGITVAALKGLITMSLAQFLGGSGDTMEMMQAVLDTNFWLATHVTVVTTGYAATLVAGFLGIVFVVRLFCTHCVNVLQAPHTTRDLLSLVIGGILGGFLVFGFLALGSLLYAAVRWIIGMPRRPILAPLWGLLERSALDQKAVKTLGQMIYGIICFATLMSFTGTVLGGIWADQSWGRFWGWDPKENGALIIVIWNAMILHARWGGMIKQRGMAVLAIIGNIVTGWSGIGTNQLGVGLHAYGFSNKLAVMLFCFWASQVVFIVLGLLPTHLWRSFGGTIVAPRTARA